MVTGEALGDLAQYDLCVVGSGFFGSVIAEHAAREFGSKVLVLEKRKHTGGNSFSELDSQTGIEVHKYGSHIFHTSDQKIWNYVNRFSGFNEYRHRVLTNSGGRVYSMPINLGTINSFYGKAFTPKEATIFLEIAIEQEVLKSPKNFEEKAISLIGRRLYDAFIKGYSEKQWETELTKLPPGIISRLPVRFNYNDRYFDDTYEGIPLDGYGALFKKMLADPLIHVVTDVDYFALQASIPKDLLTVYTGPIDRFFDFKHGHLGWRTLDFESERLPVGDFQGTSVMNYADKSVPFTRIHEFRHYHPERRYPDDATVIFREYSRFAKTNDEPYYPINTDEDKNMLAKYKAEVETSKVIFGGRLATYKYMDMHQVVGAAMATFERVVVPSLSGKTSHAPLSAIISPTDG